MPTPQTFTFPLRPIANLPHRSAASIAENYTPKTLDAHRWSLAREVALDLAHDANTTDKMMTARLGALAAFLATTRAWDGKRTPLLRVILTSTNVRAWQTQERTRTAREQARAHLRPLARHLTGAKPPRRLRSAPDPSLGSLPDEVVPFVALNACLTQHFGYQPQGPMLLIGTATPQRTSTVLAASVIQALAESTSKEPSMTASQRPTRPPREPKPAPPARGTVKKKPLSRAARIRAAKDAKARQRALDQAGVSRPVSDFTNSDEVLYAIDAYRPREDHHWDEVRHLAAYLAQAYQPPNGRRAQNAMTALVSFLSWYATSSYREDPTQPITLAGLQGPDLPDAWVVTRTDLGESSRATYRAMVRTALANADKAPRPENLPKRTVTGPYTPAEVRKLLALAAAQPTKDRSRQTLWLASLSVGAGLSPSDFRHLRRSDITTVTIDGTERLVVTVPGTHPRAVPVTAEFEQWVRRAMAAHDKTLTANDYVLEGKTGRKQVLRNQLRHLDTTEGPVPLNLARMRSTWLFAAIHTPVPLTALLDVAGLVSAWTLTDLAAYSADWEVTDMTLLALVNQEVR